MGKTIILGLSALIATSSLSAKTLLEEQEESLVKAVIPSTKVLKVKRAEVDGFYKAYLDNGNILYVNPFKRMIFIGELYTNTGVSLTSNDRTEWQNEANAKKINDIDLKELTSVAKKVDFGKGSQRYEFFIFTDPECPYCAQVEELFIKGDVSAYISFVPLSFHKNAKKWSEEILSAPNFKEALIKLRTTQQDLGIKITPKAEKELQTMIELSQKMGVDGTPQLFVIDKKENKIIDTIQGANLPKINSYLSKDKQ